MASSFVSKAADIAKRKLELKAKPERKEKVKTSEKVAKNSPAKPDEDQQAEKKVRSHEWEPPIGLITPRG